MFIHNIHVFTELFTVDGKYLLRITEWNAKII